MLESRVKCFYVVFLAAFTHRLDALKQPPQRHAKQHVAIHKPATVVQAVDELGALQGREHVPMADNPPGNG